MIAGRRLAALATFGAVAYHGALLVGGSFRRTYDAFVHIFFADHYARSWFELWEPRWYTGFTVTSYPPGSHQLVALLSKALGLEAAFALVQLGAVVLLVTGVYRFARIWAEPKAAGWAAVAAALASGIGEAVHVFGQLPTTLALGLLLHALPGVFAWVHDGDRGALGRALALLAATTAAHHVTTIFGMVLFAGPVVATALLARLQTPCRDEPPGHPERVRMTTIVALVVRRLRRIWRPSGRGVVLGAAAVTLLGLVILPYWLWSRADPITQIPIPHASRDSFLGNPNAGLVFWVVPWGAGLLLLPAALWRGLRSQAWPLAASALFSAMLGTGGTTPLPRMLLGGAYDILTLDRFTFWATVLVLPLYGMVLASLWDGAAAARLGTRLRGHALTVLWAGLAVVFLAVSLWTSNLAALRSMQPDPIDPAPITAFLDKDQHSRWRYLTLGFGDQMAWVSAQTTALTVDGNYHSARRLPELVSTPVERLEGAKFRGIPGIGSLQQFLAVPEKYHLKYVFSNDQFYDPLLFFSGWHAVERLANGVVVWEREDVPPLPSALPRPTYPAYQRLMWGVLPPLALLAAGLALLLPHRARPRRRRGRVSRLADAVDAALLRWAAVPDGIRRPGDLRAWRNLVSRLAGAGHWWRRLGTAVVAFAVAGGGLLAVRAAAGPDTPADTVVAYYDALDFHDLARAWAYLDPATRPTLDEYLLDRSVSDGLVASYSMLDAVLVTGGGVAADAATVDVELVYVTALAEYRVERSHRLVRRDGGWFLAPDPVDPFVPEERFVRRATVAYASLGRRLPTTDTTTYADVLDRPELAVASARLVEWEGRLVLVGELVNTDVDPADVTVTGQLLGGDGHVLARFNSAQLVNHKVRPGESTPFRIDFEDTAGADDRRDPGAGDFRPDAFTPLRLTSAVATTDVYAKAVVTDRHLDRPLTVDGIEMAVAPDGGLEVSGRLRNDGIATATVARVLVTGYDAAGEVAWVGSHYLERSIRVGHDGEFSVRLPPPPAAVDPTPRIFVNGLPETGVPADISTAIVTPAGSGYHAVAISAVAFTREAP